MLYLVSYDLRQHRDYTGIIKRLNETGGVRLLESLWVIEAAATAMPILDDLKRFIDGDDALVVLELNRQSAWAALRAYPAGTAWLQRHIP